MSAIIHKVLKQFQFTDSEIKVYLALLQNGYSTGYEAAKHSGVPRSKIYGILDKLHKKGAIEKSINLEQNNLYKAIQGDQLSALLSSKYQSALKNLELFTKEFEVPKDSQQIWSLQDYESITLKIMSMIKEAKEELLIQIWHENLSEEIQKEIKIKEAQNLKILTILYDRHQQYAHHLSKIYIHGFENEKLLENGASWLTIVSDRSKMIHASYLNDANTQAFYTQNKSMVYFAQEYVLHDAYCLKLIDKIKTFDSTFDMNQIRDVF